MDDSEYISIKFPKATLLELRVAIAECPCRAPKSTATIQRRAELRKRLDDALAKAQVPA